MGWRAEGGSSWLHWKKEKGGVTSPTLRTLLVGPCKAVLIRHCEPVVHRVQPACFLAMAHGHVLHFGPRKTMGLRLAGRAQGIAKRIFGVDCDSGGGGASDARRPAQ